MMEPNEDLDSGLARRISAFADAAVVDFDADETARQAIGRSGGMSAAFVARLGAIAATVLLAVVTTATILNGNTSLGQTSVDPRASEAVPTATPRISPPASPGLSLDAAVLAAQTAIPEGGSHDAVYTASGPAGSVLQPPENYEFVRSPGPDQWVWIITLSRGESLDQTGAIVVLDYFSGEIYGVMNFIS